MSNATIMKRVQYSIDGFDVPGEPVEHIEPFVSIEGDRATVRFAVEDLLPAPFEWAGLTFWNSSPWAVFYHTREEVEAMPHIFEVEMYEHGLVSFSLVGEHGEPSENPSILIGVPDDYTYPQNAARAMLDDYTSWCNGDVYGVWEVNYTRHDFTGRWSQSSTDSLWSVIGAECAQRLVEKGI